MYVANTTDDLVYNNDNTGPMYWLASAFIYSRTIAEMIAEAHYYIVEGWEGIAADITLAATWRILYFEEYGI